MNLSIVLLLTFTLLSTLAYFSLTYNEEDNTTQVSRGAAYLIPILVAVIGLTASIASYRTIRHTQQETRKLIFIADSKAQAQTVERKINASMEILINLKELFDASTFVSDKEFSTFVTPTIDKYSNIKSLVWIPNLENASPSEIEGMAAIEEIDQSAFQIETNKSTATEKGKSEGYFPILYIEPFANNERLRGVDLSLDKKHVSSLLLARDSGNFVTIPQTTLFKKSQTAGNVLIYYAVYKNTLYLDTITNRQRNLRGYLILELSIKELINAALHNIQAESNLKLNMYDNSDPSNPKAIFKSQNNLSSATYTTDIVFAGRKWQISISDENQKGPLNQISTFVLLTSLIFTLAVTFGLIHLIRRRKWVEDLVQQRTFELESLVDKLADSNQELTQFAYVCSHDLQEPLRMIKSFSIKLQSHLEKNLLVDEIGKKYFNFVTDGADRAQNLIADILSYSSLDSNTQSFQTVDCNKVIKSILHDMTENLRLSGGKITHDAPLPTIKGNKTQLLQLLQNLITNGLKYHKTDTHPHVHISVEESGDYWKFCVTDNGIGIQEKYINKIFQVFQRLHGRNQYSGTGIGLSICKKVVERHDGSIWVESEIGIGSRFYFTLPKAVLEDTSNDFE